MLYPPERLTTVSPNKSNYSDGFLVIEKDPPHYIANPDKPRSLSRALKGPALQIPPIPDSPFFASLRVMDAPRVCLHVHAHLCVCVPCVPCVHVMYIRPGIFFLAACICRCACTCA